MLVEHLPPASALHRSKVGATWTQDTELLAGIFDVLQLANWQRSAKKNRRPKPTPRPSDQREQFGTAVSAADMRVILDTWGEDDDGR